ncbi:MAG: hypothetical protein MUC61_02465, partial [Amoebophilaceae bacterium]|nr:hypothetical protein [Amoebophilaceae bacterium]
MQKNRAHRWGHSPHQSQTDLFKSLLSKQLKLIKLGKLGLYAPMLAIVARIVSQQRGDTNKVYSLDEPSVSCIAKGKVHRKYEFG